MSNTLFNEANDVSLSFQMAQFFVRNVWPIHHFDGDGSQVTQHFFATWRVEHFSHVLTDLSIQFFRPLIPVYAYVNPAAAQLAYLAVAAA